MVTHKKDFDVCYSQRNCHFTLASGVPFYQFFVDNYARAFLLPFKLFGSVALCSGILGMVSMLFVSLHEKLHIFFAVLSLTAGSTGVAIADVTVDACVAQSSNKHQHLAADMQSLCSLSSATGSLLGFFFSGLLVHLIGPKVDFCISNR